jgi:hypothetical protein
VTEKKKDFKQFVEAVNEISPKQCDYLSKPPLVIR